MFGRLALAMLAATMLARADDTADALIAAGIVEFSAAFRDWDGERFGKAAGLFRQASNNNPQSALAFYWCGTALFHQMLQLQNPPAANPNPQAAAVAADAAVAALEAAVKLDPGNAEAHALLGTLAGMKIKAGWLAALRYGPSVQAHQQQALKCGATNPRVLYLLGAGQFHTAKDAASRREALSTLLSAEKLFRHESQQPLMPLAPRWGYSSCLTFIGRAYHQLGRQVEAVAYYRRALAMHPADHTAAIGLKQLTAK